MATATTLLWFTNHGPEPLMVSSSQVLKEPLHFSSPGTIWVLALEVPCAGKAFNPGKPGWLVTSFHSPSQCSVPRWAHHCPARWAPPPFLQLAPPAGQAPAEAKRQNSGCSLSRSGPWAGAGGRTGESWRELASYTVLTSVTWTEESCVGITKPNSSLSSALPGLQSMLSPLWASISFICKMNGATWAPVTVLVAYDSPLTCDSSHACSVLSQGLIQSSSSRFTRVPQIRTRSVIPEIYSFYCRIQVEAAFP